MPTRTAFQSSSIQSKAISTPLRQHLRRSTTCAASRRETLLGFVSACSLGLVAPAFADVEPLPKALDGDAGQEAGLPNELVLPWWPFWLLQDGNLQACTHNTRLHADFVSLERKLIKGLNAAIQLESEGAKESEVRRKADQAKGDVREFINKWKDARVVRNTGPYKETAEALEELGQYYMKRGQRAALDKQTAGSVTEHLRRAEEGLPPEEEKSGLLGGLFGGK